MRYDKFSSAWLIYLQPNMRSQESGVRSQEEWGIIEELVGKIVTQFFCHNHPKILEN
ncbi:MAG: hypothetical protein WBA93_00675 [Microcoleaceae cyanobacterium]